MACYRDKFSTLNSVAWVRERTILIERPPLVGGVSAKFWDRGCHMVNVIDSYGHILGFLYRKFPTLTFLTSQHGSIRERQKYVYIIVLKIWGVDKAIRQRHKCRHRIPRQLSNSHPRFFVWIQFNFYIWELLLFNFWGIVLREREKTSIHRLFIGGLNKAESPKRHLNTN
jgi:hypothetical protein